MIDPICWCGGKVSGDVCLASRFHDPERRTNTREPQVLYLSGPMTGYPDCNYPLFHAEAAVLRSHGYIVHNPAAVGDMGSQYTDLLREDIRAILGCGGVATLEGWWSSKGAQLEITVAGAIGLPVRPVHEWVHRTTLVDPTTGR